MPFALVVPAKELAHAKSRLEVGARRRSLAVAFAADAVAAAVQSEQVSAVYVVTDDPALADIARVLGAVVLPDEGHGDLNEVLRAAVGRLPHSAVAAMCADLPCLTTDHLSAALEEMPRRGMGFVPDHVGTGTTLLAARNVAEFNPQFGPGSCAAHLNAGAIELAAGQTLRLDVDTMADLAAARHLGVGLHTKRVLDADD